MSFELSSQKVVYQLLPPGARSGDRTSLYHQSLLIIHLVKDMECHNKKLQKSSLTPQFLPSTNSTEPNELMFISPIKFQSANPPLSIPEYFRGGLLLFYSLLSALRFKDKIPPIHLGSILRSDVVLIFAVFWKKNLIHLIHILIKLVLIIKMILTAES